MTDISFESANIFKGTASYYGRFRRPYPEKFFSDIADYYGLDGKGTLLDLGCGTGELTVPLAPHFEKAIGLDPSQEMLAEAKARAEKEKVSNVRWITDRAENIDISLGALRLTTAGVSIHWMNQPLILEKIYAMTEAGGGMVITGDSSPVRGKEKTEDWKMKRKELIVKYLGAERRAGDYLHKDVLPQKHPFEKLIADSPFRTYELKVYEYTTERNIDEIIGFLYSTSYANKRILGEHADEFERELREELLKLVPANRFMEDGKTDVFLMRK